MKPGTAIIGVFVLAAICTTALGQAARGGLGNERKAFVEPVTAGKIRTAIDDAVMFLRNQQREDGSWNNHGAQGGSTALAALTLLASGASPESDDQLKKALDCLAKIDVDNTYVRAIRANVWEYALRKVPHDKKIRDLLKADFEWLVKALGEREGWRYTSSSTDWDNSCTQYGVLGIWAAQRAGFETNPKLWETMSKHFRSCQNEDGGWTYTGRGGGSTANMATAGLASMFLVFDMFHGRTCYSADKPDPFSGGDASAVLRAVDRGMTWLGKCQTRKDDGYYLYGVERTGVASGRKYFGGEDWFAHGALSVLKTQDSQGSIRGQYGGVVNTCFCALFLIYGGAPVAFNKLQYGQDQDWNLNPRDISNLTRNLWSAYEKPLNWQTVSLDPQKDASGKTALDGGEIEAPILFISGSKAARFTETQMIALRNYLRRGGTILAEASDHSEAFTKSMETLALEMFPRKDYPGSSLEALRENHPIYTVLKQEWKSRPKLRGMSDGSRTFFLLSDDYLSGDWQKDKADSDAFKLGLNLLFYVTDRGELEGKFASIVPDSAETKERKITLTVARVKYAADARNPRDWDVASCCWERFVPYAKAVVGCELKEAPPVTLGKDSLKDIRLLHITGRIAMNLSSDEQAALKQFVKEGGTVLVDSFTGAAEFARSSRTQLESLFGPLRPLSADHVLAEGRFEGGSDLSTLSFKLPARQTLRARGEQPRGQKLLVAFEGPRPAVLYSEMDVSAAMAGIECFGSSGYKPASARKIVANLLGYLTMD